MEDDLYPTNGLHPRATRYAYDGLGSRLGDTPAFGKRMNKTRHTDFLSRQTVTAYDMMGRVDLKQQWTDSAWNTFTGFDYTARGQRWKMKDPFTSSISAAKYASINTTTRAGCRRNCSRWTP